MRVFLSLSLLIGSFFLAEAQVLSRNANFGTNGFTTLPLGSTSATERGDAIAIQPDGKLLVAYEIRNELDEVTLGLARLNPDGSFDESFDFDGKRSFDLSEKNERMNGVAVLDNGNIVCVGYHDTKDEGRNGFVVMVDSDGAIVSDFAENGILSIDQSVGEEDVFYDVEALANNKFVIGGTILAGGKKYISIQQFLNDGTYDPDFNNGTYRFTQVGTEESIITFGDMAVGQDGRTAICGQVKADKESEMEGIVVSFTNEGTVNYNFGDKGQQIVRAGQGIPTILLSCIYNDDNSLMIVGSSNFEGDYKVAVVKLLENGAFDNNFQSSGIGNIDVTKEAYELPQSIHLIDEGMYLITGTTLSGGLDDMSMFIDADGNLYKENEGVEEGFKIESFSDDDEYWVKSVVSKGIVYRVGRTKVKDAQRVMISSRTVPVPLDNSILRADLVGGLYPNPVLDHVSISLRQVPVSPVLVRLVDMSGRVVLNTTYDVQQIDLSLETLESGFYELIILSEDKYTCHSLIKQ